MGLEPEKYCGLLLLPTNHASMLDGLENTGYILEACPLTKTRKPSMTMVFLSFILSS